MKKYFLTRLKHYSLSAIAVGMSLLFYSCGGSDGPDEPSGPNKRTVLVYAVASNNLYGNLIDDKNEMLEAAGKMNMEGVSMLVYEVARKGNPRLLEIARQNDGTYGFSTVAEYDRSVYSTDPRRISQVISDVARMRPAENYGLILWSHGTGMDPSFSTHSTRSEEVVAPFAGSGMVFSFGSDNDQEKNPGYYDQIDIDELADAIPGGMFDFIWFDACYMSGIEMAYELRDKCDYFVAYPTEVFTPGMPYHLTMPYFLRETPDLVGGANAFFDYYAGSSDTSMRVATVAVMDMSKIEGVADACREIYPGSLVPSEWNLQKYTRGKIGPFYDFGQVTRVKASGRDADISTFNKAMSEFVIWKAATEYDFNFRPISEDNYSGISCHLFDPDSGSQKDDYFMTLDWYKRVWGE